MILIESGVKIKNEIFVRAPQNSLQMPGLRKNNDEKMKSGNIGKARKK